MKCSRFFFRTRSARFPSRANHAFSAYRRRSRNPWFTSSYDVLIPHRSALPADRYSPYPFRRQISHGQPAGVRVRATAVQNRLHCRVLAGPRRDDEQEEKHFRAWRSIRFSAESADRTQWRTFSRDPLISVFLRFSKTVQPIVIGVIFFFFFFLIQHPWNPIKPVG